MRHDQYSKAKLWAGLTLAVAVATGGAVTIANAESGGHHAARSSAVKTCSSANPCLDETNKSSGIAIEGNASDGAGVQGNSSGSYGVVGTSQGYYAGVGGYSYDPDSGASGVYGFSSHGPGVTGYSESSYAVQAEGNVLVEGEVYTSGFCASGCSKTRGEASFGARTSEPTIDDFGEATTRGGVARIVLASDFANVIDSSKPYLVLLTPEGDAALYVANRSASGFEVREVGGGRTSVPFAYRIVAKPLGEKDERLPFKTVSDRSMRSPGRN
jgi:hypothetical protein